MFYYLLSLRRHLVGLRELAGEELIDLYQQQDSNSSASSAYPNVQFCNYGVSLHVPVSNAQWQIPIVLNFIFATILLVGTLFLAESPRYLVKIGDMHRARRSLSWLRHRPFDHHDITVELAGIEHQIEMERNMKGGYGFFGACRELFLLPSNRYKLFLCLTIQILGQLSGGGEFTRL